MDKVRKYEYFVFYELIKVVYALLLHNYFIKLLKYAKIFAETFQKWENLHFFPESKKANSASAATEIKCGSFSSARNCWQNNCRLGKVAHTGKNKSKNRLSKDGQANFFAS
jgi:hypothetical protein